MPDKDTREKRQHSTTWIPYSYYECRMPEAYMNVPMHWHGEFELDYVRQGRGEFWCGGRKWEARAGELMLVPPNMLHAAYPGEGEELIYDALVFSPVFVGAGSGDRCTNECIRPLIKGHVQIDVFIRETDKGYGELRAAADQIFMCVQKNSARMDLLLKSELLRFFWILEEKGGILLREEGPEESEAVRPALEYMAAHFREEITIEQLAALSHLSRSHFMRCFRKSVGVGAIEHLSQLRIRAACEALCDSPEQIADIAFACGYSNLSNFNRQFLKKVGCSPKEYRRRNKEAVKDKQENA